MADERAAKLQELARLLRERKSFWITSHARPDGDAIGSALGLMHLLEGMGKQVAVAFHDAVPAVYQGLPGAERITSEFPAARPDAAIVLECSSVERSGFAAIDAPFLINIDHHKSGKDYGDFNWIDAEACAVGSMLCEVAAELGETLSKAAATCLYAAIMTDTGSFQFSSTDAATFETVAMLVRCGAVPHEIADAVYFANPVSRYRLLAAALSHLQMDGAVAWMWVTQEDIAESQATPDDTEGVVNYLTSLAGVAAGAFFREQADGAFRVSLRSQGEADVAVVAEALGGGGHKKASGCTVAGPLEAAMAAVLPRLRSAAGG